MLKVGRRENDDPGDAVVGNEEELPEISSIYTELLQVTVGFLRQAEEGSPSEGEVTVFCERRAGLLECLQPLVARQQKWLAGCDRATLAESVVNGVDAQLEQMRQLEEVSAQLMERIALCRSDLDRQLGQVRSGKKALAGYGKGPKAPPRFCRGSV